LRYGGRRPPGWLKRRSRRPAVTTSMRQNAACGDGSRRKRHGMAGEGWLTGLRRELAVKLD